MSYRGAKNSDACAGDGAYDLAAAKLIGAVETGEFFLQALQFR
jgi:glutamate synthase domain-containing protein 1